MKNVTVPELWVALGRLTLAELDAAYHGRTRVEPVGPFGPPDLGGMHWSPCDCGPEDDSGHHPHACRPGTCSRGCWSGPLVWAAQDAGDTPGLWGLTEEEAYQHLLPRWLARGITVESQRAEGVAARTAHAERAGAAW